VAVSAAADTPANPDVNNIAAVAAIAALDNLLICMMVPQLLLNAAILLLPYKDPANVGIITQLSELMLRSHEGGTPSGSWRCARH
jgi:hypothetical protein